MENQRIYATPKKDLLGMQVVHFGKILFNLQFIAIAVMFASVVSLFLPVLYYLMLACVSLLTLFIIYAAYPEFASWWAGGETLMRAAAALADSWTYTVPITVVLAVGSIVCLCFDKREKQIGRIVASSVILVLAFVLLIVKLINSGAAS